MTQQLKSFISEVRSRLEKSSPEPWELKPSILCPNAERKDLDLFGGSLIHSKAIALIYNDDKQDEANADLIVHSRTDLALAIEALEKAMETIDFYSSHETAAVSGSMGKILIDRGDKARTCQKEVAEILTRGESK